MFECIKISNQVVFPILLLRSLVFVDFQSSFYKNVITPIISKHVNMKDYICIQNDDQNGVNPTTPPTPKLAQSCITSSIDISYGNIWEIWFICCLMFNDCVILHMHLLTYTIDCFCFFFTGFWSRYSVLFQKMCNSAPYYITVKTLKAPKNKNMSMARKELNIWGSFPLPLCPLICLIGVCKALFFHKFELCIIQNTNKQKYTKSFVLNCSDI